MRHLVAAGLVVIAVATAVWLGPRATRWNDELALRSPLARIAPIITDPHTPRLTGKVVMIVIDGLGIDESHLPYLDELRARGAATVAEVPYPTISRPNYVTLLAGVPPADSGVRANRVHAPVALDTAMDRVQAAGLRVATASDYGMMPNLFARGASSLGAIDWIERGSRIAPPRGITWPIDEARRAGSLGELAPIIAQLASDDAAAGFAFIPVLVLDVDRAGHAAGVGAEYRQAAAEVDRMLRAAFAQLDLTRATVIVVADHGHVARGGHGGPEREVAHVPLILAGKGVRAGATTTRARSIDVAPTVAALLGVASPGHAEGRALTELLALSPSEAARREVADAVRVAQLDVVLASARGEVVRPDPVRLAVLLVVLAIVGIAGRAGIRRGAIAVPSAAAFAGALGFVAMLAAMVVVTGGHASPSYVPSLARTTELATIGVIAAIALQVGASWFAIRRAADRVAAANTVVLVGFGAVLVVWALVRAWFSAPFVVVPSPFWFVAVPTLELACATCAAASAITIAISAWPRARRCTSP